MATKTARQRYHGNLGFHLAVGGVHGPHTDFRPTSVSEINDLSVASVLLDSPKEGITERVYRRVGAIAKLSKG